MKHVDDIRVLISTLLKSSKFHALVIESPPGWGKSSSVEVILSEGGIQYKCLGSYSTPLSFYNALSEAPGATFVLDDSAGLFSDPSGMAILKAASWSSVGGDGRRVITWNTTSERVLTPSFEFSGKLILLSNAVPNGAETRAFLSRTLHLAIAFSTEEVATMLNEASKNTAFFEDQETSARVAEYLANRLHGSHSTTINLRTLHLGYEIARTNPIRWPELLDRLTPKADPWSIVGNLSTSALSVEEQSREFTRATGLSRRTFFKYRESALCTGASLKRPD